MENLKGCVGNLKEHLPFISSTSESPLVQKIGELLAGLVELRIMNLKKENVLLHGKLSSYDYITLQAVTDTLQQRDAELHTLKLGIAAHKSQIQDQERKTQMWKNKYLSLMPAGHDGVPREGVASSFDLVEAPVRQGTTHLDDEEEVIRERNFRDSQDTDVQILQVRCEQSEKENQTLHMRLEAVQKKHSKDEEQLYLLCELTRTRVNAEIERDQCLVEYVQITAQMKQVKDSNSQLLKELDVHRQKANATTKLCNGEQNQSTVFRTEVRFTELQKVQDHEIRLDIGNVGDLYSVGWPMDIGAAFNPRLDPQLDCAVVDAHRVALIDCARHHRLVPLLLGEAVESCFHSLRCGNVRVAHVDSVVLLEAGVRPLLGAPAEEMEVLHRVCEHIISAMCRFGLFIFSELLTTRQLNGFMSWCRTFSHRNERKDAVVIHLYDEEESFVGLRDERVAAFQLTLETRLSEQGEHITVGVGRIGDVEQLHFFVKKSELQDAYHERKSAVRLCSAGWYLKLLFRVERQASGRLPFELAQAATEAQDFFASFRSLENAPVVVGGLNGRLVLRVPGDAQETLLTLGSPDAGRAPVLFEYTPFPSRLQVVGSALSPRGFLLEVLLPGVDDRDLLAKLLVGDPLAMPQRAAPGVFATAKPFFVQGECLAISFVVQFLQPPALVSLEGRPSELSRYDGLISGRHAKGAQAVQNGVATRGGEFAGRRFFLQTSISTWDRKTPVVSLINGVLSLMFSVR